MKERREEGEEGGREREEGEERGGRGNERRYKEEEGD